MAKSKYTNLLQLMEYFSNEKVCEEFLEKMRWNGKVSCPFCKSKKVYKTKKAYKCAKCKKCFSAKVGTIFENTKLPLQKWFVAIYLSTSHKKGISSLQLSKDIGVTQKTAWFMAQRIREMLKNFKPDILDGTVEIDETYVGGKAKNNFRLRHQGTQGRSTKQKKPVLGILSREGKAFITPVPDTKAETIQPIIYSKVKEGSRVMTDEWWAYQGIDSKYEHGVVQHRIKEYARGDIYTNSIESFWSIFKRGILGIYHWVKPKHLHRYCNEFEFRFNTRYLDEEQRFDFSISRCEGRLKYKELIN